MQFLNYIEKAYLYHLEYCNNVFKTLNLDLFYHGHGHLLTYF